MQRKSFCAAYAKKLEESDPQLCLLGIGENGHLAFNDSGEADFDDRRDMKVVRLDFDCREQQAAEG
jgi:glucosamine-6-phosphate deaminase